MRLRKLLKKIRPSPQPLSGEGERPIDNVAAWGSGVGTRDGSGGNTRATFPPNYVPPVDEGRPRH